MFFHSWSGIGRVVAASVIIFVVIVAMLRLVGQQALAKMSGFDVVFTVTLGSVIASVVIFREIAVSEGIAALVTLLVMQEAVRWLQSRFLPIHHAVRQPPRVLLWDGQLFEDRLLASSVSADEIRAAVRKAGLRSLSDARIVVLENDGEWSVVAKSDAPSDESAFFGLPIPGRPGNGPAVEGEHAEAASAYRLP